MHEILFRGKSIEKDTKGKWIYGFYREFNTYKGLNYFIDSKGNNESFFIDTKTAGQYTGLQDKNGVKIFEGDICKFKYFSRQLTGQIVFNEKTLSFEMWNNITVGAYGEKATNTRLLCQLEQIEVIGNVHDNPELLGSIDATSE